MSHPLGLLAAAALTACVADSYWPQVRAGSLDDLRLDFREPCEPNTYFW